MNFNRMIGNILDKEMVEQAGDRSILALGMYGSTLSRRRKRAGAFRQQGFDFGESVGGCFRLFNLIGSGFSTTHYNAQTRLKFSGFHAIRTDEKLRERLFL
mmetsp:Transcript_18192/g.28113  ORF Transcript_18192/g.28113 Transcript_18192/m.28113 type:complete len:101 (+) Transcript_18192:278-580(+)